MYVNHTSRGARGAGAQLTLGVLPWGHSPVVHVSGACFTEGQGGTKVRRESCLQEPSGAPHTSLHPILGDSIPKSLVTSPIEAKGPGGRPGPAALTRPPWPWGSRTPWLE